MMGGAREVRLQGSLTLENLDAVERQLAQAGAGPIVIDLREAHAFDTAGAWAVARAVQDGRAELGPMTPAQALLIKTVTRALPDTASKPRPRSPGMLERLGRTATEAVVGLRDIIGFFGHTVAAILTCLVRPSRLRVTALVRHAEETGLNAVPIVAVMGFLIGIVLAFQGATQLQQFGAELFVVDLIAISILRELGILLTAIIVAGRSASAFTSAIGSMKMREEVDAMRTLGLDPMELLVVPRVLALVLFLPILGLVADLAGLFGGAVMAWLQLGISPGAFRTRLLGVDSTHFLIGLGKAPFFAVIIGVIGCFQGMRVRGNAESLGMLTSRSVVQAIFMVIVADAVFSVVFAAAGL